MKINKTKLDGVFLLENLFFQDNRGNFTKVYNEDFFSKNELCINIKEEFLSKSRRNVIRGMHFQLPPYDHEKLISVINGKVVDVILDLRTGSQTYGSYIELLLNEDDYKSIYIPKGLAHGFKAMSDNTIMIYNVSTTHRMEYDSGIRFDSFGYDWKIKNPIISKKDKNLMSFKEFEDINPF